MSEAIIYKLDRRLLATCQMCGNQRWQVVVNAVEPECIIVLICTKCYTEHKMETKNG